MKTSDTFASLVQCINYTELPNISAKLTTFRVITFKSLGKVFLRMYVRPLLVTKQVLEDFVPAAAYLASIRELQVLYAVISSEMFCYVPPLL